MPYTHKNVGVIHADGNEEFKVVIELDYEDDKPETVWIMNGERVEDYFYFCSPEHNNPLHLATAVIAGSDGDITEVKFEDVLERMDTGEFQGINWTDTANLSRGWPAVQARFP